MSASFFGGLVCGVLAVLVVGLVIVVLSNDHRL